MSTRSPEAASANPKKVPDAVRVAPVPKVEAKRFRLWAQGSLRHDGVEIAPGEELPFSEAELSQLGLMFLAVPIEP